MPALLEKKKTISQNLEEEKNELAVNTKNLQGYEDASTCSARALDMLSAGVRHAQRERSTI